MLAEPWFTAQLGSVRPKKDEPVLAEPDRTAATLTPICSVIEVFWVEFFVSFDVFRKIVKSSDSYFCGLVGSA